VLPSGRTRIDACAGAVGIQQDHQGHKVGHVVTSGHHQNPQNDGRFRENMADLTGLVMNKWDLRMENRDMADLTDHQIYDR